MLVAFALAVAARIELATLALGKPGRPGPSRDGLTSDLSKVSATTQRVHKQPQAPRMGIVTSSIASRSPALRKRPLVRRGSLCASSGWSRTQPGTQIRPLSASLGIGPGGPCLALMGRMRSGLVGLVGAMGMVLACSGEESASDSAQPGPTSPTTAEAGAAVGVG